MPFQGIQGGQYGAGAVQVVHTPTPEPCARCFLLGTNIRKPALEGGGDGGALVLTFAALLPAAAVLSAVTPTLARRQLLERSAGASVLS